MFILFPSPTSNESSQTAEAEEGVEAVRKEHHGKYFAFKRRATREWGWERMLQPCLANMGCLKSDKSLTQPYQRLWQAKFLPCCPMHFTLRDVIGPPKSCHNALHILAKARWKSKNTHRVHGESKGHCFDKCFSFGLRKETTFPLRKTWPVLIANQSQSTNSMSAYRKR